MGLDQAMNISVSGIEANRIAMEVIDSNIANISTTRSLGGGPYRRQYVLFEQQPLSFSQALEKETRKLESGGVKATVLEDYAPFHKVYDPGHPDADAQGYVSMPNVSLPREMVDLVEKSKYYEANITAFNATKKMGADTLQIQ